MSSFEQMLTQEPAGKIAVALIDRLIQSFNNGEADQDPEAPVDGMLLALAMLLEPDESLQTDEDFVRICTDLGNRLLAFLKGSREFREAVGKSAVRLVSEGLSRSATQPEPD